VSLRKRLIDLLGAVQCNGQRAHSAEYLVGLGAPLSLYTAWSVAYSSLEVKAKYFAVARSADLIANGDADFASTSNWAPSLWPNGTLDDIAFVPVTAVAVAPGTPSHSLRSRAAISLNSLMVP
jgi:hypothetical protein